jgi:hypothetical protein
LRQDITPTQNQPNPTVAATRNTLGSFASGVNSVDRSHPIYQEYRDAENNHSTQKRKFEVVSK